MDMRQLLLSLDGRINRAKFWGATVALAAVQILLGIIVGLLFADVTPPEDMRAMMAMTNINILISLIFLWPSFALQFKRCHDRGRSGWFLLISLIPILGWLWLMVELGFLKGTTGPNRFGADPLGGNGGENENLSGSD